MVDIIEDEIVDELDYEELQQEVILETGELMTISLQAFTCETWYQTIRVTGYHE